MLDERSVQTGSTPFNIFENEGNVVEMLNESFLKTDLNLIQHTFNKLEGYFMLSTMLNDLFKRPHHRAFIAPKCVPTTFFWTLFRLATFLIENGDLPKSSLCFPVHIGVGI